jgi:hypothetical protein
MRAVASQVAIAAALRLHIGNDLEASVVWTMSNIAKDSAISAPLRLNLFFHVGEDAVWRVIQ